MFDRIGVCSWSLRPTGAADLVEKARACEAGALQLALDPLRTDPKNWPLRGLVAGLQGAKLALCSGMLAMEGEDYSTLKSIERTGGIRPDETWERNLGAARENAEIADQLGIGLVTFHAGFIPHVKTDKAWGVVRDRVLAIAECFARFDISVALETGQEPAAVLYEFIDEIDNPMIGLNFDPANIVLYGCGDPVEAFRTVAPFVDQLHLKDATPAAKTGEWGTEVVVGTGAVAWRELLEEVGDSGFIGDAVIEREAGETRVEDIRAARRFIDGVLDGVDE